MAQPEPTTSTEAETPDGMPLSQLAIWGQQRVFYERMGRNAWRGGFVPEYITSNPFIAHAYAEIIAAYWRDSVAQGRLDPGEPRYLLELGAGSGRFAFLFLVRLTAILDEWVARGDLREVPQFTYIMTDLAAANLAAWQANSRLAPHVAAGRLDFARFDVTQDTEVLTIRHDLRLAAATWKNPGVVIANYLFDSIPSDLYCVEQGQLYERRIEFRPGADVDLLDRLHEVTQAELAQNLAQAQMTAHHRPVEPDKLAWAGVEEHEQAVRRSIVRAHMSQLDNTVFPLPVAALDACRRLRTLMGNEMLLLVGDKGYVSWAGMQEVGKSEKAVPGMALHSGAFSLMLNFPALAHYAEQTGGIALVPAREPHRLGIAALLFQGALEGTPSWTLTRRAYARHVLDFSPDDFYVLAQTVEAQLSHMTFAQLLALLRLARWDPQLLAGALPALASWMDTLSAAQWDTLRDALVRTMAHEYPSTTRYDLAHGIGRLLFVREQYADALACYALSREHQGTNAQMLYEIAVCRMELGQPEAAIATLDELLAFSANHVAARDLRAYLRRKWGR